MRIIAQTNGGFILEAKEHELYNLLGRDKHYLIREKCVIGAEFEISPMFTRIGKLANAQPNLQGVCKTLEGIVAILQPISPILADLGKDEPTEQQQ